MTLPEETPVPEEPRPSEGFSPTEDLFSEEPALPEGFTPLGDLAQSRARRRRAQRMLAAPGEEERAAVLENLARRTFPSFEFFLFAFACGVLLGAAYLLDAPGLLLVGLLISPLLTPWVGMILAAYTGAGRFFLQTLLGLLVAGLLVTLTGALAGFAGRFWAPLLLFHANIHAHLWWPDLLVVVLGSALLVISFVRSEQKPVLPGILLAYGLFLPLAAAGVGLGIQDERLWPSGVLVFLVHLSLAALTSLIVLAVLRFKAGRPGGILLTILIVLLSLFALFTLTGLVSVLREGIASAQGQRPTPTLLALPSATASPEPSLTPTPEPSATPTLTPTNQPTPSYAVIAAATGGGALLRTEPGGGTVITPLSNGILVEVLPEIQSVGSTTWVRVRTATAEGWVLQAVLTASALTPTYTFTPSITATP
jgi:hypothetical protein